MNGRQARGWGISAHEMTNTTTKKAANSIVGKLTAGILAVAAVLPVAPAAAQSAGGPVLVVGDSLEVGSGPYLRQALAGTPVEVDAQRSRSSARGRAGARRQAARRPRGDRVPAGHQRPQRGQPGREPERGRRAGRRALHGGGHDRPAPTCAAPPRPSSTAWSSSSRARPARRWRTGARPRPPRPARWGATASTPPARATRCAASLLAEAVQGCLLGGDLGGIPAPEDPNARDPRSAAPSRAGAAAGPSRRPRGCPRRRLILALGAMSGRMGGLVDRRARRRAARPAPGRGRAGAGRARES